MALVTTMHGRVQHAGGPGRALASGPSPGSPQGYLEGYGVFCGICANAGGPHQGTAEAFPGSFLARLLQQIAQEGVGEDKR